MLFAFAQRVLLHNVGENNIALEMRINFWWHNMLRFPNIALVILDISLLLPESYRF